MSLLSPSDVAASKHLFPESAQLLAEEMLKMPAREHRDAYHFGWGEPGAAGTPRQGHLASMATPAGQPIMVRDEYVRVRQAFRNLIEDDQTTKPHGIVFWGQPGIGKSLALNYFLAVALELRRPVIIWRLNQKSATAFLDVGVVEFPADLLGNLEWTSRTLLLCDSVGVAALSAVPTYLARQPNLTTLVSTSPQPLRIHDYQKEARPVFWTLAPWRTAERLSYQRVSFPFLSLEAIWLILCRYSAWLDTLRPNIDFDEAFSLAITNPTTRTGSTALDGVLQDGDIEIDSLTEDIDSVLEECRRSSQTSPPIVVADPTIPTLSQQPGATTEYYSSTDLWEIYGPVARYALEPIKKDTGDPIIDLFPPNIDSAVLDPDALERALNKGFVVEAQQADYFHRLFLQIPTPGLVQHSMAGPRSTILVASPVTRRIISNSIRVRELSEKLRFYKALKGEPGVLAIMFESATGDFVAAVGLKIRGVEAQDLATIEPGLVVKVLDKPDSSTAGKTGKSLLLDYPQDHGIYSLWKNFPAIDYLVVTGESVFLLQATISARHPTAVGALKTLLREVRDAYPGRSVVYVFVGLEEKLVKRLAKREASKRISEIPVGWAAIEPNDFSAGVKKAEARFSPTMRSDGFQ